jgi:hypothetical protein
MSKEQFQRLSRPCESVPGHAGGRLVNEPPAGDSGHGTSWPATLVREAPAAQGTCRWEEQPQTRTMPPLAQANTGASDRAAVQDGTANELPCGSGCGGHSCDGASVQVQFPPELSPRREWVIGLCPRCQSPTVGNWYRIGGRGDCWLEQCWRSLIDWPACTFSQWLPGNPYPPKEEAA